MKIFILFSFLFSSLWAETIPVSKDQTVAIAPIEEYELGEDEVILETTFDPEHYLLEVNKEAHTFTLDDGSVWVGDPSLKHIWSTWRAGDKIIIAPGSLLGGTHYEYVFNNSRWHNLLFVNLIKVADEAPIRITKIDHINHTLELSNHTKWKIHTYFWIFMKPMAEGDRIIIGHSRFSDYNSFLLIDADTDFSIEAILQ